MLITYSNKLKQPFNTESTDTSYYDRFLNDKDKKYMEESRNVTGDIYSMTPYQYYEECADMFNTSVQDLTHGREYSRGEDGVRLVDSYKQSMLDGDKFPLCFIDYANKSQEGLHRMYAAGEAFGWSTKFPVLIVTVYDEAHAELDKKWDELNRFLQHDIDNIADMVTDDLVEQGVESIDDMEDAIYDLVQRHSEHYDHDLDFVVFEDNRQECYHIRLTKFDDLDVSNVSYSAKIWYDDLFETVED